MALYFVIRQDMFFNICRYALGMQKAACFSHVYKRNLEQVVHMTAHFLEPLSRHH